MSRSSDYSAHPIGPADWLIRRDGQLLGRVWLEDRPDDLGVLVHAYFFNGLLGKAKILQDLIPLGAWVSVPVSKRAIALFLERKVGLKRHLPVFLNGEPTILLQRVEE